MSLTNTIRTFGHYVEQPDVIHSVGKYALGIGSVGGIGALTAVDTYKAQPQDRNKVLTRDALVLGSTLLGTWAVGHKLMPLPSTEDAIGAVKFFIKETKEVLDGVTDAPSQYKTLSEQLDALVDQKKLKVADYKNIIAQIEAGGHPEAKTHLAKIFEGEEEFPGFSPELLKQMCQAGNPSKGIEEGELRKMANFFLVGGASVLSGLTGGIVANKVNGNHDPDATTNMVKEGVFQFIANIALCAVGASAAIFGMQHKPIAKKLAEMGGTGKLLKTAGIGAGLSLGIFGGGVIANQLGRKVINPLCDKIQGKEPQAVVTNDPNQGKRKIEFWDAILHLDDVPTAMALAGLEIVEPFIPLFFGFSGYRTGIGYRNDETSKANGNKKTNTASPIQEINQPQGPENQVNLPVFQNPQNPPNLINSSMFNHSPQTNAFFTGQDLLQPWANQPMPHIQYPSITDLPTH